MVHKRCGVIQRKPRHGQSLPAVRHIRTPKGIKFKAEQRVMRRVCIENLDCLDNPLFGSDVSQRRSWLLATLTRIKRLESIWIAGVRVRGSGSHAGNPEQCREHAKRCWALASE